MGRAALGHTGRCFIFIFFWSWSLKVPAAPQAFLQLEPGIALERKAGLSLLPRQKGETSFLASQAPPRKTRLQIALLPTEPHAHTTIHTTAPGEKTGDWDSMLRRQQAPKPSRWSNSPAALGRVSNPTPSVRDDTGAEMN